MCVFVCVVLLSSTHLKVWNVLNDDVWKFFQPFNALGRVDPLSSAEVSDGTVVDEDFHLLWLVNGGGGVVFVSVLDHRAEVLVDVTERTDPLLLADLFQRTVLDRAALVVEGNLIMRLHFRDRFEATVAFVKVWRRRIRE